MIKVAIDIRFLHVGMGRRHKVNVGLGGIGRVMLSRLREIDPTNPKFSFTLIVDSRRYSLVELKEALPQYKQFNRFLYRFYLLPGLSPSLRRSLQAIQEQLNRLKASTLDVDIIECHDEFWHVSRSSGSPKRGYKSIVFVHDYISLKWKDRLDLEKYITGLKNADHIATVSESIRQELIHKYHFPESKITTIYNGLDKSTFKVIEKTKSDEEYLRQKFNIIKPYVIYIGSWGMKKNVDKIIAAFERFRARYQEDLQLVLVGNIERYTPSQTKKIRALISGSPYSKDIIEIGYLQDHDIVLLNNYAKAFIHLAYYEGFCQGVAEAMACGTPIIASKEVAVAKELGLADELLDPVDTDSIAERIQKISSDSSYREALLKKQFQVVDQLSWKRSAQETLTLYEKVMNS
ncbi:MAG: glycosyltransferase family 1 protein [Chloroherpetonaceae bacterium]